MVLSVYKCHFEKCRKHRKYQKRFEKGVSFVVMTELLTLPEIELHPWVAESTLLEMTECPIPAAPSNIEIKPGLRLWQIL